MKDKLREAFDQVQADEELKNRTKTFIFQKTNGYTQRRVSAYGRLVPVLLCLLFLFAGGHWLYFTPTVEISIDINPSIELGINRFDRIISVKGYNRDGEKLTDSLNIKHMNYAEAVNEILQNEKIADLLGNDEIMSIGVIGKEGAQSTAILSKIESCTAGEKNTYCYYAHAEETEAAHEMGLSCGKYRALLELKEFDPDVTAEEIRDMTMREIRNRINELSGDDGGGKDTKGADACGEKAGGKKGCGVNSCGKNVGGESAKGKNTGRNNTEQGHHGANENIEGHKHRNGRE